MFPDVPARGSVCLCLRTDSLLSRFFGHISLCLGSLLPWWDGIPPLHPCAGEGGTLAVAPVRL